MAMKLAPLILYTRHGELYLDAVAIEREGRPLRDLKLGTFKLAGLHIHEILRRTADVQAFFDPTDSKYEGVTVFAVELQ